MSSLRGIQVLISALLLIVFCGCHSPKGSTLPTGGTGGAPVSLSAGDVVRLTFTGAPEFTQSQRVRNDGKINLPLVGEVDAAGRRLPEFQAELGRLYKSQLQDSNVVVTLESSVTPVFLSGAVNKTGKIVLERPTTLFEVIMEAGGFAPMANQKRVHVIRQVNGKHQTQFFDLSPAMRGEPLPAVYVQRNDVIHVPERMINL